MNMLNTAFSNIILLLLSTTAFSTPVQNHQTLPVNNKLYLLENKGQVVDQHGHPRTDIDFKINTPEVSVFVGNGQLHYQWTKTDAPDAPAVPTLPFVNKEEPANTTTEIYRLDIELLNANKNAVPEAGDAQSMNENYYLPQCPAGITANSYNKVVYRNIYPNIDWVLYTKDNTLKYDFIVHKGGNPADIKIKYNGATSLKLHDGALIATTPFGTLTEGKPYSYTPSTHKEIASTYRLKDGIVSFDIAPFDSALIIDPAVEWCTYFGGSSYDRGFNVATDTIGNVYFAGTTESTTNIATTGAFQTTKSGLGAGYLAKMSASGALLWATYLSSGSVGFYDEVGSMFIDKHQRIYVAGSSTLGSNLSTLGAHQVTNAGSDCFLLKFNTNGSRIWGTYYGGSGGEGNNGNDLSPANVFTAADTNGYVYLYSSTTSDTGIATAGAHKTSLSPHQDVFLAKFDSAGNRIWGTYIGGDSLESSYLGSLSIDVSGNIFIGGFTNSLTDITTGGTYKTTLNAGHTAGFINKFNSNGVRLWGTYLGSDTITLVSAMTAMNDGGVVAGGYTCSDSFITGGRSWQPLKNSRFDAFLVKLTSTGNMDWGTYIGGEHNDIVLGLHKDNNGHLFLSGWTLSATDIATTNAIRPSFSGISDGMIMAYDTSGRKLWSTYYGGSARDELYGIHYYKSAGGDAHIYSIGDALSSLNIATSGAHQTTRNLRNDAILLKLSIDTSVYITAPYIDSAYCAGDTMRISYDVLTNFRSSNSFTIQLSNASGSFAAPVILGTIAGNTAGVYNYIIPDTITPGTGYRVRIVAAAPAYTSADNGRNITIGKSPAALAAFSNAPLCTDDTLKLSATTTTSNTAILWTWQRGNSFTAAMRDTFIANAQLADSGDYIVTASIYGCAASDTIHVSLRQSPLPVVATGTALLCVADTIKLQATGSNSTATYIWQGPVGFSAPAKDTFIANASSAHNGYYIISSTLNGCTKKDTLQVRVYAYPTDITATANATICEGSTISLTATTAIGATAFNWSGPNGFTASVQSPVINGVTTAAAGNYIVTATNGVCNSNDTVAVTVFASPVINTITANTPVCIGRALNLTATASNATGYVWSGPGGYTSSTQNPTIASATAAVNGIYAVIAYNAACSSATATVNVTTATGPVTNIYPSPGDSICSGSVIKFTAVPSAPGLSPQYQWYKNNIAIPSATTTSYTNNSTADKDIFYCTMTTTGVCADPYTDTSNYIPITVLPWLTPSVSIAATPNTPVNGGDMITFNATPVNGGTKPVYQWKRNNADVIGAVSSTWGSPNLANADTICVVMTSSYRCPSPATAKSNCIVVQINTTGIETTTLLNNIKIYPNPVTDAIHIEGIQLATTIQLFDVTGRLVINTTAHQSIAIISTDALAAGTYMLQLTLPDGQKLNSKITKQ